MKSLTVDLLKERRAELVRPAADAGTADPDRRSFLSNMPLVTALFLAGSATAVFGIEGYRTPPF
jgi:hypothetical protein